MHTRVKFVNKDKSVFFQVLRERVDADFREQNLTRCGGKPILGKSVVLLGLLLGCYALVLSDLLTGWPLLGVAVLLGVATAGVGMSVMHDANHGSFSSTPWINAVSGASLYLLGGNVLNWKVQHNTLHHTYTNIHDMDEDITGKYFLRLCPTEKRKGYHRFQHIYAFFLYGLMTFSFFVKDFRQAIKYHRLAGKGPVRPFTGAELLVLFSSKVVYVLLVAVLPLWLTSLTFGQWLLGFVVMHFTAGLILSIVFQLAHIVEGAHQPMPDAQGSIPNAWAIHQLETTANFGCPRWLSWYIGGLDYQVEHHLFPSISHIHYRRLSKIVRQTAEEFRIPYNRKPTFGRALQSHYQMLRSLGTAA